MPGSFEVEIRARISSERKAQQVKQKLVKMQFQDLGEKRVKDTVYGLNGMYSVKWNGFCYRVREYGNKIIVDKKGTPSKDLTKGLWKEEIIPAKNRREADKKLRQMELSPYLIIDRLRHEFRKGDIHIAVDNVANLGHFIEVEQMVMSRRQLASTKKRLVKVLESVGVQKSHIEPRPYGWILALKFRRNKKGRKALAKSLGVKPTQLFPKKKCPRRIK